VSHGIEIGTEIRDVELADAAAIVRIDTEHSGEAKPGWWEDLLARHTRRAGASKRVGLVAVDGELGVVGYLLGQVRAFEFGSEPCGWIFAVGVHPERLRSGVASALFETARARFASKGIRVLRTMVRRDDVPVLTFFRGRGFAGGPYVELELTLGEATS
jgi:ribosomal protein S18 acetylase RimI-like enzyme